MFLAAVLVFLKSALGFDTMDQMSWETFGICSYSERLSGLRFEEIHGNWRRKHGIAAGTND